MCIYTALFSAFSVKLFEICGERYKMFVYRESLVLILFVFLLSHVFFNVEWLYKTFFKYRYLIAAVVLLILVLAKINFSSIGMFNYYIQPSSGSEFTTPIFGTARAIRSDEWAVSTPRALTYQYCAGEKYNDIIMATETPNSSATSISPSLSILGNIYRIGYLFLGVEYAVSFYWCSSFIVGLLSSIELCYIISGRNKLTSVIGGILTIFSSFFLWWSGNDILVNGITACVCIYYFLNTKSRYFRILMGILTAVFGASFVCVLYPAWQVPFGYLFLAFIIWSFVNNFSNVKTFKFADWIIFAITVFFALLIIGLYFYNQLEYMAVITNTVYPGSRFSVGGYALKKLFLYPASFKFPFDSDAFPASEYGTFFSFFPFPAIYIIICMIKSKKLDLLAVLLSVVSLILTLYCTFEIPAIVAKITLLSNCPSARVVDVIGFIQILIIMRTTYIIQRNNIKFFKPAIMGLIALVCAYTCYECVNNFPIANYLGVVSLILVAIVMFFALSALSGMFSEKFKRIVLVCFAVLQCAVAVNVLPIQKGLDVFYSKPISQKISEIVNEKPDAIWIAHNQNIEANYYAASGAKVINSNNYMPNIKFWEKLFPNGEYEEIYNRYAHLIISLTNEDNEPILNQDDVITLKLNYSMLDDFNVDYIVSKTPIEIPKEYEIDSKEIYYEEGIYIYNLEYK